MPIFEQGHVVRVPFPYTDGVTLQRRPALVVSADSAGEGGRLLWVAMIISASNRPWPGDVHFGDTYRDAGLPVHSVVRACKIATVDTHRVEPLGAAPPDVLARALTEIHRILGVHAVN